MSRPPARLRIVDAAHGAAAPDAGEASPLPELREEHLYDLLVAFYEAVELDELLRPYFAVVDMQAHMPRIVDFWSTLLFHTGRYTGNAFRPHLAMPGLTPEHFRRWLAVLERTVRARHAGPAARQMLELGHRVAYSMQLRLGLEPFAPFRPSRD